MQLGSIELLYISVQILHKVKITKRKPREGYAISACLGSTRKIG
jgi:hypothetical protein